MTDLATLLTGGSVGTVGAAIVTALAMSRRNRGDYAAVASEISRKVAEDLRQDNAALKKDLAELDGMVDRLRERMSTLIRELNIAIVKLEHHGEDTTDMRNALRVVREDRGAS